METETLIYILFAGIIALLLALFQYFSKTKSMSKLSMLFAFLRFISYFSLLLLLINPSFEQVKSYTEKPNLIVAIDNSSSIKHFKQENSVNAGLNQLKTNKALNDKFDIEYYKFGETFQSLDSLSFSETQTNIFTVFGQLSQIYKNGTSPCVIISDGNQTYGNDYEFISKTYKQPIYPVIIGDTIKYTDLKIQQLNVNKYAFLKNKFPIEAIVVYNGTHFASSKFEVKLGNKIIYSKNINFTKDNNSEVVNFTLPANRVGAYSYKASVSPLKNEKNSINNTKNFAVEVIDEQTKVAIVSEFFHPDLGVLKKSIESNEQRSVSILNTKEILNQLNDFQLVIMYQPNNKFKAVVDVLNNQNRNRFTILGPKTDLSFVNAISKDYSHAITNQTEEYQAGLVENYKPFVVSNLDFESFPPLLSNYGSLNFNLPYESILTRTKNGTSLNEPLLLTYEIGEKREAILLGENIWKWRAQSYLNSNSFYQFDDFMGKLIQYLGSNKLKSRLNIDYKSFYEGNNNVVIKAEVFDKNYVFDTREDLNISLTNETTKVKRSLPFVLKNNNYQVDLSSLSAGIYNFTVKTGNSNLSKSGKFEILEFNVEQQFLNADVTKLERIATNSKGQSYFIHDTHNLAEDLLNDKRYVSIQKSTKKSIPLIDWKYLLAIIVLSLSLEWFLRKYNGLI